MTNMAQPSVIDERLVGGECRFGDVFLTRFGHTLQGERPHGRLGLHFPPARPESRLLRGPGHAGIVVILLGIALLCSGCEPYAQIGGSVGVADGKTNDVRQVDVNFDGKLEAKIPGV